MHALSLLSHYSLHTGDENRLNLTFLTHGCQVSFDELSSPTC